MSFGYGQASITDFSGVDTSVYGGVDRGWTRTSLQGRSYEHTTTYVHTGQDGGETAVTHFFLESANDRGTLELSQTTLTSVENGPGGRQVLNRLGSGANSGSQPSAPGVYESDENGDQWLRGQDGQSTKMTNYSGSGIGQQSANPGGGASDGVGIENLRRQVTPGELTGGHARSKHGIKRNVEADLLNNPGRVFTGTNENGRRVDIYWRAGSVAITAAGDKTSTITAYGPLSNKGSTSYVDPDKWATDENYVEVDLSQPGTNVKFPNSTTFQGGSLPWN